MREEASRTSEAIMFEEMWWPRHQDAYQALAVIGQHHPQRGRSDGLRQHVKSVLQVAAYGMP